MLFVRELKMNRFLEKAGRSSELLSKQERERERESERERERERERWKE